MPFPMPFNSFSNDATVLYDDFLGAVINPAIGGTSENSGTAAIVVAQRGGVGGLVTGASSGNRSAFTTGLNYLVSDGGMMVQWRMKSVSSVATRAFFVGWTDTVSLENPIELNGTTFTSNATDAAGFVFDTDATTDVWYTAAVNTDADKGGNAVTVNGGTVAPTADVYENFRVEITPDGDAIFSYGKDDGLQLYTGWQNVATIENAVATTALLTPVILIETRTAGASTAYVDALGVGGGRELD